MVDLNFVCDQQLRQNDKAIITVFILRKGVLVLHFKYNNNEPNLKSKSNQTNIITLILGHDRINCNAVVGFYFMQRDRRWWRDINSLGRLYRFIITWNHFLSFRIYENMSSSKKSTFKLIWWLMCWIQRSSLNVIWKYAYGYNWTPSANLILARFENIFGGTLPLFSLHSNLRSSHKTLRLLECTDLSTYARKIRYSFYKW